MTADGTVIVTIPAGAATDFVGNSSFASSSVDNLVTYDTTVPAVTANQEASQADPTAASPINFTVEFSKPVSGFGAEPTDVTISGTAGATTAVITGGPTTYNVAVSGMASDGTVTIAVPAGAAVDSAGNLNSASTSSDDTVTYDTIPPTATVDQAAGQLDPTPTAPIHFTVSFSEPVTGFGAEGTDVTLSGTAGATTVLITGGPTIYDIEVNGMAAEGTITVTIPAGAAADLAGNPSLPAMGDDTVVFDLPSPSAKAGYCSGSTSSAGASGWPLVLLVGVLLVVLRRKFAVLG
jgi:hypothetical protein